MSNSLYLDSRDLINVIRSSNPVSAEKLVRVLVARNTVLVFSFSNVFEVVNFGDKVDQKRRALILDSFPKVFIKPLPRLLENEFWQSVVAYYCSLNRVPPVLPFKTEFQQTLGHHFPTLPNWTFPRLVEKLLEDHPDLGKNTDARLASYMHEVAMDRSHSSQERNSWPWFRGGVAHMLIKCGIGGFPKQDLESFCQWLMNRGEALPAWRVFHGAQTEFTNNTGDGGEPGDPPDYSHITAVPYGDAATLDNRMRGYYTSAIRRLKKVHPEISYFEHRVFRNLGEWMSS